MTGRVEVWGSHTHDTKKTAFSILLLLNNIANCPCGISFFPLKQFLIWGGGRTHKSLEKDWYNKFILWRKERVSVFHPTPKFSLRWRKWNVCGTVRKLVKLSKGRESHCRSCEASQGESIVLWTLKLNRLQILTPLVSTYRTLGDLLEYS